MEDTKKRQKPKRQRRRFVRNSWARLINYIKSKLEKRRAEKQKQTPADRAARSTATATWVIVLLTLVIAALGFLQWDVIRGQLKEMQNTSEITKAQLAASLTVEWRTAEATDTNGKRSWFITPNFRNTGGTKAMHFTGWHASSFFKPAIPQGFDFFPARLGRGIYDEVIQPGDGKQIESMQLSADVVKEIQAGKGIFVVWLYVEYRDVFPNTPTHHIRQCAAVSPQIVDGKMQFAFVIIASCSKQD